MSPCPLWGRYAFLIQIIAKSSGKQTHSIKHFKILASYILYQQASNSIQLNYLQNYNLLFISEIVYFLLFPFSVHAHTQTYEAVCGFR